MAENISSKFNKKSILATLIFLAVPTVIEEIMSTLLQYVDTAMVGNLGEKATASVSVTTTVNWLIGGVFSALGVAAVAMISESVGRQNTQDAQKISSQIFILTVLSGVLAGTLCIGLSPVIPVLMGAEKDIQKDASVYFAIISLPMIFRAINTVMAACLRATKNTKTPMVITLFENVLNIVLNYFFIYILKMGVIGAGVGSAISFTVSGALMLCEYRKNEWLSFSKGMATPDKKVIKLCLKTAYPVFLTHSVNCMGYVVFAALVSSMGTTVFAAHSIAVSAEQIFYIAGYGFRSATSTMIGISIGERNESKFRSVQKNSILITVIMMILSGTVLYFVASPLMDIFTNSANVVAIGAKMLRLVAFSEPFFGLMIVLEGIYYGLGKTKYVFATESVSMWCVRIAFTFLCVKIWKLDLTAVWYCMIADNLFKAFLLSVPFIMKRVNFPVEIENR